MDSLVLLWTAAEIEVTRPHLQKPLYRVSNFTSTLLSLFCFSTCISTTSPWPSPHASCSLMRLQLPASGTEEGSQPEVLHTICVALSKWHLLPRCSPLPWLLLSYAIQDA